MQDIAFLGEGFHNEAGQRALKQAKPCTPAPLEQPLTTTKPQQVCKVTFGYRKLLLPFLIVRGLLSGSLS